MPTEQTLVSLTDGRLDLRTGRLAPRLIHRGPDRATVALLATTALLLGGDHVSIRVRVGRGQSLVLNDVAATVAYNGRGLHATMEVDIELAADAILVWDAEPLVLSTGAAVQRSVTVYAAAGARLLLRDQLVLGRASESGGTLTCRTRMAYNGTPALAEDLELTPDRPAVGILGTARVLDTAIALGWRPPAPRHGTHFELHTPGAVVRDLVSDTHLTSIPTTWDVWDTDLTVSALTPADDRHSATSPESSVGGSNRCTTTPHSDSDVITTANPQVSHLAANENAPARMVCQLQPDLPPSGSVQPSTSAAKDVV